MQNIINKRKLFELALSVGLSLINTIYHGNWIMDNQMLDLLRFTLLIKGIECQTFYEKKTSIRRRSHYLTSPNLIKQKSIEAIDNGLNEAINKLLKNHSNGIDFSLTRGWDGRVVFS